MKTKTPKPPLVVVRKPHSAVAVLVLAKAIYDDLDKNKATFKTPNPALAQFSADIAGLDAAQLATHTRAKGTVEARDAKLVVVLTDISQERGYVQTVVDADPANAATIAQNAGFSLRKSANRNKSEVAIKPNKTTSGSIDIAARVGGVKAAHQWQYSADGKVWTDVPPTLQAKTTLHGLTPGSTVYVRHRAVTKTGPDLWSQAVSMIVV